MSDNGPLGLNVVTAVNLRGLAQNVTGNIIGNEVYHVARGEVERYKDGAANGSPFKWDFPFMSRVLDFYDRTVASRR